MSQETAKERGMVIPQWYDSYANSYHPASLANPMPIQGVVSLDADVLSPFGDLLVAPIEPLVQLDFVHGVNSQAGALTTVNSATADTNASRLRLQTGTNSAGAATFMSRCPAKYRPGQGIVARWTTAFTTGVASSTQYMGMGNSNDGYFFGYNGTAFGILHRLGGSDSDWIPRTSWNVDKCDGVGPSKFNWTPTYGNVVAVKYPYLGYGNVTFWVQNKETGRWIMCHIIKYVNTSTATQLSNPNLSFYAKATNAGNTTNLTMYCGSVGVFLCGQRAFVGSPKWAMDSYKTAITTETALLNIKNCGTYNGVTNRSLIRLNSVSFSNSGNNSNAILRFKYGATLGGSPSYACIAGTTGDSGATITSGNSVATYDVAATTVAAGTFQHSVTTNGNGTTTHDLTNRDLIIAPGEIMTVSGYASSSSGLCVSLNWTEDI